MIGQISHSCWIVPLGIFPLHDIAIHSLSIPGLDQQIRSSLAICFIAPVYFQDSLEDIATALRGRNTGSIFCYYHPLDASGDICKPRFSVLSLIARTKVLLAFGSTLSQVNILPKMRRSHLGLSSKVFTNVGLLDFCILRLKQGWTSSSSQPPTANILTGT
ncbi:hypothetical protein PGTUg99_023273 [Puccinia graminis f. sp. tritici]|uniref:Uncharacterized protein n=1 Tax=Puccinia graminis f. sp. tritici TaxID=56615 RepID=A0A5B0NL48_PUCGR|nr:hypothetical protein PGTUg99_023273 [Puccinia graminis f. sp. tritici]